MTQRWYYSVKTQHNTLLKVYAEGGSDMTVLHNKIKQLRNERKVNQQELADFLGIERTSLSKIENMEYNPSAKTMLKVCEFFDLSIGDIFNKSVSTDDTKEAI